MAVAGQAQLDQVGGSAGTFGETAAWRQVAKHGYNATLFLAGAALLLVIPPRFEYSWPALASVVVVSLFLALNERPEKGFNIIHAPMAAILAAAVASVGAWALVMAIVAWSAIHMRLLRAGRPLSLFASGLAGQIGMTIFAVYAMLGVNAGGHLLASRLPMGSAFVILLTIVTLGMVWQTIQNALVGIGLTIIAQQPSSLVRYWRAGLVASLWAYPLAGMYAFGGIVGAVVFYYVVAQTRMVEKIIQAAEARDERDFVASQFHEMMREFVGLLSPDDAQFAGDVRYLAIQMGRKVGLPKRDLDNLGWAAEFHEIGKCKLSADVRAGVHLTPSQQQERLRYPMLGAKVLRKASRVIPEEVAYAVEHQCEAFDGSGYPHAMRADRIPVNSRIIAICRDYLQLLTGHEHTELQPKTTALRTLSERAGTQYDPALVDLLCREIA